MEEPNWMDTSKKDWLQSNGRAERLTHRVFDATYYGPIGSLLIVHIALSQKAIPQHVACKCHDSRVLVDRKAMARVTIVSVTLCPTIVYIHCCDSGLMTTSGTCAVLGKVAILSTRWATSAGFRMRSRCSWLTATGRRSRIGVSTSPG